MRAGIASTRNCIGHCHAVKIVVASQFAGGTMREILLAEDNPADVYLLREALLEHSVNCAVRVATDGKDVLAILSQQGWPGGTWPPALIILDLNLPLHDGIEILQRVRAMDQ